MFDDIDRTKNRNSSTCISNAREVSVYAKKFQRGRWTFLGLGDEEELYGTCKYKPEGKWDQQADQMIEIFARSGHPICRGMSALNRGTLKRNTIHITTESTFAWSEHVHFRRKRTAITAAGCARSWFFHKKLTQDKRSRGKFDSRRATSHRKRKSRIHQDSLQRNATPNW